MRFDTLAPAAFIGAIAVLCLTLLAPSAKGSASEDCGSGVTVQLSSAQAAQGGLLEVTVHNTAGALTKLKGEWDGKPLPFWRDAGNEAIQHALLGIDLEKAPRKYDLTVDAELAGSERVVCRRSVSVVAGRFAMEKLSVAPKFVELSPQDLQRADREHQRLKEIFARATPERLWQGSFRLPLDRVERSGNFGRRRVINGHARSPHTGLDIPAPAGTPVHAPQRGRVVLAEELFFSGNTVVLDHGLGVYTLYGHLQSIGVKVNDVVETGAVLGQVGSTGRATGPHLHWGLTVGEARVNPLQIVSLSAD